MYSFLLCSLRFLWQPHSRSDPNKYSYVVTMKGSEDWARMTVREQLLLLRDTDVLMVCIHVRIFLRLLIFMHQK